eukprot:7412798-Pyramimonas_sp.AAC.1
MSRSAGYNHYSACGYNSGTDWDVHRPVMEDCMFDGGLSEWTVHSAAWAEEWERNQQVRPLLTPS